MRETFNRYRRKRPKVDASIFNSALSHTRRSDASQKKGKKIGCPLFDVFACGQVSGPRLYRLKDIQKFQKLKPHKSSRTKVGDFKANVLLINNYGFYWNFRWQTKRKCDFFSFVYSLLWGLGLLLTLSALKTNFERFTLHETTIRKFYDHFLSEILKRFSSLSRQF